MTDSKIVSKEEASMKQDEDIDTDDVLSDEEEAPKLKEYRATTEEEGESSVSYPNVASSSVVLHLQIPQDTNVSNATDVDSHNYEREFLNYKPDVTLPYAYTEDNTFRVKPEEVVIEGEVDETNFTEEQTPVDGSVVRDPPTGAALPPSEEITVDDDGTAYALRVTSVLKDFETKSKDGDWPLSTSVSCYWCCHPFTGPPLGLPVKSFANADGFYVTGCFCSLACASAFNLDSRDSHDTVCERQAMLAELSRMIHANNRIKAAPDWKSLQKFGGYMTIEQFRNASSESKVILANIPPMRSLTTQLEEVNEGDVGSGYNFVPLDPVRIERGMQELSLKRTKPRFDYKNSLDHKMNVVIKTKT